MSAIPACCTPPTCYCARVAWHPSNTRCAADNHCGCPIWGAPGSHLHSSTIQALHTAWLCGPREAAPRHCGPGRRPGPFFGGPGPGHSERAGCTRPVLGAEGGQPNPPPPPIAEQSMITSLQRQINSMEVIINTLPKEWAELLGGEGGKRSAGTYSGTPGPIIVRYLARLVNNDDNRQWNLCHP